jgi:cyclic beta-1,2-glucan synthetase
VLLLYEAARIILRGDGRSMEDQVSDREEPFLPKALKFTKKPTSFSSPVLKDALLLRDNGIGGFRTDGNEYVIRLDKGRNTPAPWINVIANPHFGFLASEAGSGFTWARNSRENKLTPWSNDAVLDPPGEVLYIGDADTGELWTATSLPIREEEPYMIRHGFGYSVFEHASHGIEQWLTQHVPVDASVKVSVLGMRNTSDQTRHLTLTYYVQPVLGVSGQSAAMHIRSMTGASGALLMENPWQEEYAGSICFLESSQEQRTVTGDRREFFGAGDIAAPDSLLREGLSGTVGTGFDPCAAIQVKMTLAPNERTEVVFLLGWGSSPQEAEALSRQYREIGKARESLAAVKTFWKEKLNVVHVKTPVESMNLLLNGWLPYQVISCRLWARSGFYQSGGAFGFRDQLQDSLSIAQTWPELTRAQILLHAGHQFVEGDVQHWWHEPLGKGTRTHISDDLLWLPYATAEYVRITGDEEILGEEAAFLDEPLLTEFEEERYGKPHGSSTKSSLYDHCIRAVDAAMKFGHHGLPLIGSGDWNDGMNEVGSKGSGESVWLGWFMSSVLEMMAPLCRKKGDSGHAEQYEIVRARLSEAIEKDGWDGNWYRRAYFDNGQPLGSVQNSECRIDSIAQTWSVISGAGNPQRASQAMSSVEEYLVRREDGLIKLLAPPFSDGDLEPGYIKGYVPGVRENGGQYTHAAAWAIIAFAKMGDGDKAAELFDLINPINHTGSRRDYTRYKAEPYVMAADVYAVHPHAGRGGWSWYTGSAGWMYRAGLENILGFQKTGNSLAIHPSIPRKWKEYVMAYKYLDTSYEITVRNPDGATRGVRQLTIDGIEHAGNLINLVNDGIGHHVDVLMGIKTNDPEAPAGV